MCQRKKEAWSLVQQDAEAALSMDSHLMKVLLEVFSRLKIVTRSLMGFTTAGDASGSTMFCVLGTLPFGDRNAAYYKAARVSPASKAGMQCTKCQLW